MRIVCGGFEEVLSTLNKIAETASTKSKQAVIAVSADNPLFLQVVDLALDPYQRFKMTGNIEPAADCAIPNGDHLAGQIIKRLLGFTELKAITKENKQDFSELVQTAGPAAVEVVNRILNKDLRCGASIQTFRNASPSFHFLPVHHPMKGIDDLEKFYRHAGTRENICWSYKLDGTRTWAVVSADGVLYLSSNGHALDNFHGFDEILLKAAEIASLTTGWSTTVFDGEVVNIQGDFSRHMSQFRRLKNMDPSGFRFRIFDMLPKNIDDSPFSLRYDLLKKTCLPMYRPGNPPDFLCSILPHLPVSEHPRKLARQAVDLGLEGLMLKTWDHVYQTKRSNDWCKIKFFHSEDLPVIDKVEGTGKHAGRLGALVVLRGKTKVEVGSGFTDGEREEFWQNPPACIEVKYQDALASGSLRFPIFVRVRDDKDAEPN